MIDGRVVWNRRRVGTKAGSVVLLGQVRLTIKWKIGGGLEVYEKLDNAKFLRLLIKG
jgi:hypothetical protein